MEDAEYRVFVRIPIARPSGFVDPPSFVWNADKESRLWKVISRRTRGDINCTYFSETPRSQQSSKRALIHLIPLCCFPGMWSAD
jgi:Atg29 N-terminal domain